MPIMSAVAACVSLGGTIGGAVAMIAGTPIAADTTTGTDAGIGIDPAAGIAEAEVNGEGAFA